MMAKPAKYSAKDATRYRLRMVCNEWYLFLYKGDKGLGALGPWPFDEANAEADKLAASGVKDWDKDA